DRAMVNQNLAALTERLSSLTDHMRTEQSVMLSLAETQASMKQLLTRLADGGGDGGFDKATTGHIRNLDLRLERLSPALAHGRHRAVGELRRGHRPLTRTLAARAEESCRAMYARRRGSSRRSINSWPGFVDGLSNLLLVVIFVLMVFMVAQFFLSVAI